MATVTTATVRAEPLQTRIIMLADLDYFFAQCEELRNSDLKDKPVVVAVYSGRTEDSGAVSTANYLARKHGVKSGIPIFLAKKKLENTNAVFLPVDHKFYEEISDKIMQILRGYADSFEQAGIDEAYLDVTQKTRESFEEAKELAQKIKDGVKNQQKITCSIGVGPNKLVAKIAAGAQKPDGLTIIEPEEVRGFLSPLPVDRLMGVGRKIGKKMENLGIRTIGDLASYDVQKLVEVFGKNLGVYFHNAANGVDDEPVKETGEAESISRISTLKENTRDLELILEKTDQLCTEIHTELIQRGISFKQIGIIAIMSDLSIRSRSEPVEKAIDQLGPLKEIVRELFEKFLSESTLEIRRVGVKISHFAKEQETQKQLTSFLGKN